MRNLVFLHVATEKNTCIKCIRTFKEKILDIYACSRKWLRLLFYFIFGIDKKISQNNFLIFTVDLTKNNLVSFALDCFYKFNSISSIYFYAFATFLF